MVQKNIIKRIISNPLVQTFLIYVSGGWIALEMTDYIINKYGLNEKISDVLPIILLIGLPVAIFLAWYLSRAKEESEEKEAAKTIEKKSQGIFRVLRKKPWFSLPGAVVLILIIVSGIRFVHRQAKIKWATEQAIPGMEIYLYELDNISAFELCQKVRKYISDDPAFIDLDSLITAKFTILTTPEGGDVYYKEYPDVDGEWIQLGTTPIVNLEMPNWTLFRWKIEKPGYEVVYAVAPTHMDTLFRTLHEPGEIPDGMVYVEGINNQTARNFLSKEKYGFFIDRYEVTNQQFKKFIDHGGYQNSEYWQNEFILNNDTLTFEEAIDHFKDATGRPGPATWEAGDYPDGQEDHPVGGVSWHEAAAYSVYTGKTLPTLWHWRSAAGYEIGQYRALIGSNLIPLSNMGGSGPEPVGSNAGISCFGTYDMAGNIKEWCWNKSPTERMILGGAWNDVSYMSTFLSQLPAFDRSSKNGFRCAFYPDRDSIPEHAFQPGPFWIQRDYNFEEPVSETEFQFYKKQFHYDKTDLRGQIEERDENPADWIIEKISFDAAYENERMIAYLFLPKESVPPFQTIIFFPGAYAQYEASLLESMWADWNFDYILKNGRAVMFPIYKGTYERRDGSCDPYPPGQSHQYTECLVKWVKDFSRSIDYLETREDIDIDNLGYLGDSWGGTMGAIIPAVEDRLKLSVLIRGGLPTWKHFPEADDINYVSHVKIPVLMLNGKYDFSFPLESTVITMFDLLGTTEQHKTLIIYDTDHFVPKTEMIKETLNWLDKYFGPINK